MPRPKRTKVAPSVPAARRGRPSIVRKAAKEAIEDISDDEERNVMSINHLGRERAIEIGIPGRDPQSVARTVGPQRAAALEVSKKRRDAAMGRLEAENNTTELVGSPSEQLLSSPEVELGRRANAHSTAENSILAVGNFRRRPRQPSILGTKEYRARSSSVESNLAEGDGLTNRPRDGSLLARGNFRRRQRQPSILGRAPSRARSSSLGLECDTSTLGDTGSAIRTGIFRRRTRQPSILGTGKKNHQTRPEYDVDDEDEDDFNPEDESTPLNLSKTKSTLEKGSQPVSSASNPRKRKLSPLPPLSSPATMQEADFRSEISPSRTPSEAPAATRTTRLSTPEPYSETMAPPRSSSSPAPVSPQVLRPSRRTNVHVPAQSARRQPTRNSLAPPRAESIPSSPPSLTHSPNRPVVTTRAARGRTRARPHPSNLSTIELQALLPRRRRRQARDPFDVESSSDGEIDPTGLGSDEDELTHLTTRTSRTTRSLPPPHRVSRLKPGPKSKNGATKTSNPPPGRSTYLSRRADKDKDKENQHPTDSDLEADPDDSLAPIRDPSAELEDSQELEERVGKELKTAKRKFEVVDRWELEFEDVTAGSSSPWDAR